MGEPRITRNRKDKSPDKKDDKDKSKSIADSDLKNISTEKVVKEAIIEKETKNEKKLPIIMPKNLAVDTDLKKRNEKPLNKKLKSAKIEEARLNEVADLEDEAN